MDEGWFDNERSVLFDSLRYTVIANRCAKFNARYRNGGNRGSLCTLGINNVSRTMGPRARSTSARGRESKRSRIYVCLYLPTCPPPSALFLLESALYDRARPSLRNISPLLGKNATGRSPSVSRPVSRVCSAIAYLSFSLSLSLPASLRTESNFYTISISLLALILVSFSCDCNFTIVQQFLYFWIS